MPKAKPGTKPRRCCRPWMASGSPCYSRSPSRPIRLRSRASWWPSRTSPSASASTTSCAAARRIWWPPRSWAIPGAGLDGSRRERTTGRRRSFGFSASTPGRHPPRMRRPPCSCIPTIGSQSSGRSRMPCATGATLRWMPGSFGPTARSATSTSEVSRCSTGPGR